MEIDRFEKFYQHNLGALKSIQVLKTKNMEKYGLTGTHTICLRVLYDHSGGLTKSEITALCEIDKAQITRIVNDLLKKEYVYADGPNKAYNKRFFLTEKGRTITDEINDKVRQINTFVSKDIPNEDIESFYRVFGCINEKLKIAEDKF